MPLLEFPDQNYSRYGYRVPQTRLVNMYPEATPSGPGKSARYPRPTLKTGFTTGSGAIKGLFQRDGVVGGYKYSVSGTELYKDTDLVGTVASGTLARFAGSADQLALAIGGKLYCYDGTTLSQVKYFKGLATGTLTLAGNAVAAETVTLGAKTYTWRAAVGATANEVKIGASASDSIDNLIAAIMLGTGSGTLYGSATTVNADATATTGAGDTMTATAKAYNDAGLLVATTETMTNGSWGAATLTGLDLLPTITGVTYAAGRFYVIVDASDRFYWSDIDDLTMIDALSFATAESAPDTNVEIGSIADEIWFFGKETVEPWYQTGQSDIPVQRSQGRRFEKGTSAQGSVVALDNTFFFLGNDHLVYRAGQVPTRISTHAVESDIERCSSISTVTAYGLWFAGHTFYVINIPGITTYAYDVSTSTWAEWTYYGRTTFLPSCCCIVGRNIWLGSGIDGNVYSFSDDDQSDLGQPVTYLASAVLSLAMGNLINFSLMLQCTRGLGTVAVTTPVVDMRYSDDAGQTWTGWRSALLGKAGEYSFKAIWRRLGQINSPGRMYEFRCTDNVPIVYEFVQYNQGTP